MSPKPVFDRQSPEFYAGDALHRIKQQKVQSALERSCLDGLIFFKAEAVRYITDFYAKGLSPLHGAGISGADDQGTPACRRLHLGK